MILDCTKLKASYFTFSILYETDRNGMLKDKEKSKIKIRKKT